MNPPTLQRQDSLDSFVSIDDLVDELYHGAPYVPPARPLYGREAYEQWADARKFPLHGLRNYGRNTVFADRVPEFTQVHTMTKPVDQVKQDFNELKPLTRISNPPEGIPPNRQYAHGKGLPKTISMGGTIIDLTNDEVTPARPAKTRINPTNKTTYYFDDDSDYEPPSSSSSKRPATSSSASSSSSSKRPAPASSASSSRKMRITTYENLVDLTGDPDKPVEEEFLKFKHIVPKKKKNMKTLTELKISGSKEIFKTKTKEGENSMIESLATLQKYIGADCNFFNAFTEPLEDKQSVHIVEYDGMPVAAARVKHHSANQIEIEFLCGNMVTHMGGGHAMVRHIANIAKNNKDADGEYLMTLKALPSAVNAYKRMGLHFYNRYPQLEVLPTMYTDDNKPLKAMEPGTHPIGPKPPTTTTPARKATTTDFGIPDEAPDSGYPDNGYNDEQGYKIKPKNAVKGG